MYTVAVVGQGFGGPTNLSITFCTPISSPPRDLPSPAQQAGSTKGCHHDHALFWWSPEGWGNWATLWLTMARSAF